ncbi:MAG TPA: phosphoglycolate phosphatase [Usitatibacter sp.]|nr:phosphoglycolate phosphatase [Usitatibacter sp.]
MLDAVLFDLDGTLADTAPDMALTVNAMLTRRGKPRVPVEKVRPLVSQGARGMILGAFGIGTDHPDYAAMREEFLDIYAGNLCIDTALFPGMAELLQDLEARAIGWGVVTNKFERLARPVLAGLGLEARAAVIVGGDTCARPKPFPDSLLHAAATMNVTPARTLYVGDDERDVRAARAAGMPVVVAGYGYLGDGPPPAQWNADAVLDSCPALHSWIVEALRPPSKEAAR